MQHPFDEFFETWLAEMRASNDPAVRALIAKLDEYIAAAPESGQDQMMTRETRAKAALIGIEIGRAMVAMKYGIHPDTEH
jgi:hypothetical protein